MKKIASVLVALVMALTMLGFVAGPASAHVPNVTADCSSGLVIRLTSYGQANVTVKIDNEVVESRNFTRNFSATYPFAQEASTSTYNVVIDEQRDGNQYDSAFNGTVGPCGEERKTDLCHATGSETNPFVKINISTAAAFNGHLGQGHQNGEDIIPPFTFKGQTYEQNWDAQGQAIFNNDCVKPVVDVCPEIDGNQPEGTDCTPEPPVCTDECEMVFVPTDAKAVTNCTGVIVGEVLRNVVVPAGRSCTLVDTYVNGSVRSVGGHDLHLADANVRGSINVKSMTGDVVFGSKGSACNYDPYVGGSIKVVGSHNVLICQASVCHDVVVQNNDGKITLRESTAQRVVVRGNKRFEADGPAIHRGERVIRLLDVVADEFVIENNAPRRVVRR